MANTTGKKFAGRQKGTPNKRTQQIVELAKEMDADPFIFLVNVMLGKKEAFGEESKEIEFHTRMEAAKELMPYLYGKRKPVDAAGNDDHDPFTSFIEKLSGIN